MTSLSSDLSCSSCAFWDEGGSGQTTTQRGDRLGLCRQRAPTSHTVGEQSKMVTRWPQTTHVDWCGDHATVDEAS